MTDINNSPEKLPILHAQNPIIQEEQLSSSANFPQAIPTPSDGIEQQLPSSPIKHPNQPRSKLSEFRKIQKLGEGSFGSVYMADKISNDPPGKLYAIKQVKMATLDKEMKSHQIYMEKLQIYFDCPGIPKMYMCFKHGSSIFFISDYAAGGPFDKFLRFNCQSFLFKTIQFYVAEMVYILEYLHTRGLAHRDFKPENMVLTKEKHLQLIDFGTLHEFCEGLLPDSMKNDVQLKNKVKAETVNKRLGAVSDSQTAEGDENDDQNVMPSPFIASRARLTTFCGTNDYLSPEMLTNQQCDMNGDLWALGCIIYQMYQDKTPFHSKQLSYDMLRQKILACQFTVPENIDSTAQDLIKRLLVLNPSDRIGGVVVKDNLTREEIEKSYATLKSHPFFKGIVWETLYEQTPPLVQDTFIRVTNKKKTAPPPHHVDDKKIQYQQYQQNDTSNTNSNGEPLEKGMDLQQEGIIAGMEGGGEGVDMGKGQDYQDDLTVLMKQASAIYNYQREDQVEEVNEGNTIGLVKMNSAVFAQSSQLKDRRDLKGLQLNMAVVKKEGNNNTANNSSGQKYKTPLKVDGYNDNFFGNNQKGNGSIESCSNSSNSNGKKNEKIKNSYLNENASPQKGRNTILSHIDNSNGSDKKNSHNDKKNNLADSNEEDGIMAASPRKLAQNNCTTEEPLKTTSKEKNNMNNSNSSSSNNNNSNSSGKAKSTGNNNANTSNVFSASQGRATSNNGFDVLFEARYFEKYAYVFREDVLVQLCQRQPSQQEIQFQQQMQRSMKEFEASQGGGEQQQLKRIVEGESKEQSQVLKQSQQTSSSSPSLQSYNQQKYQQYKQLSSMRWEGDLVIRIYTYKGSRQLRHEIEIDEQTQIGLLSDRLIIQTANQKRTLIVKLTLVNYYVIKIKFHGQDNNKSKTSDLFLILKKMLKGNQVKTLYNF